MLKQKLKALSEPFELSDIEWRVGNTNQKSVARQTNDPKARPTKGMMLPYVTNRAIMNRLDSVVGAENWTNEFRPHHSGTICRLGIRLEDDGEWIYKEDGADNTNIEPTKGGLSDSMKRAAVQFGIGRYLYNAESPWVDLDEWGRPKNTPTLKIKGELKKKPPTQVVSNDNKEADEKSSIVPEMTLEEAFVKIADAQTEENLLKIYQALPVNLQKDGEVIAKCTEVKKALTKK